jgi:hypothetical protein
VQSIRTEPFFQDAALLERAFGLPVANRYRAGLDFQRNGSFCGPTSVVNVLRSVGLDADQATVLAGAPVRTWLGWLPRGMTLDQLAEVVRVRTGRPPAVLRDLDLPSFRDEMRRANDPGVRYVANFSRAPLFGLGGGHHSPVAGYLEAEDLVLVLDVNRHYRPWLAPTARFHEAVHTHDAISGRPRGLVRVDFVP